MDNENTVDTTAVVPLGTYEGVEIPARPGDQYVNATAMCQATGARWSKYKENDGTEDFLDALASELKCPKSDLCISVAGRYGGTWVHRRVAIHLAQWCSPEFAVWVSGKIEQLLLNGSAREHDEAAIARVYGDKLAAVLCGMENRVDLLSVGYDEHQRDIAGLDGRLHVCEDEVKSLANKLNDRLDCPPVLSVQDFQFHVRKTHYCLEGKCLFCRVTPIVNLKGQAIRGLCKEEYFYSPTDNSRENTCLACFACHIRLEEDKEFHKEMAKRFEAYQEMCLPTKVQGWLFPGMEPDSEEEG